MILTVPNILTALRLVAALGVAACFAALSAPASYFGAFLLFTLASATDWLDGRLARAWNQQSRLGEMLDPIADKAIVLITLEMPHLNWSTVMIRKRRTENGKQAAQARGNSSEVAAG